MMWPRRVGKREGQGMVEYLVVIGGVILAALTFAGVQGVGKPTPAATDGTLVLAFKKMGEDVKKAMGNSCNELAALDVCKKSGGTNCPAPATGNCSP